MFCDVIVSFLNSHYNYVQNSAAYCMFCASYKPITTIISFYTRN